MNIIVAPGARLIGEISLAGDKSLSHRMAVLAALAEGESHIENYLVAGVTRPLLHALTDMGVEWHLEEDELTIIGNGLGGFKSTAHSINCGNSATTMRLLAGTCAAAGIRALLDGTESLRRRPMKRIIEPLRKMGVDIEGQDGCAPLMIRERTSKLSAIEHTLPVASAQVKSAVLLAALSAPGTTIIHEPGPSRDHTERLFHKMGIQISSRLWEKRDNPDHLVSCDDYVTTMTIETDQKLPALQEKIPGDPSSAAFLIVAALITPGSEILLRNVCINPTRMGLVDALRSMGAHIDVFTLGEQAGEPTGNIYVRSSPLTGGDVSGELVVRMIDEFPAFAVAAAFADGQTNVSNAEELRYKESDRIAAMCRELRNCGIRIDETSDGFCVHGGSIPRSAEVNTHNDHRLAMSLALVGLAGGGPVKVRGAEIFEESFPKFTAILTELGANLMVELSK